MKNFGVSIGDSMKKPIARMKDFTRTAVVRANIYRNRVARRIVAHTAMMQEAVQSRFSKMGVAIRNFSGKARVSLKEFRAGVADYKKAIDETDAPMKKFGKRVMQLEMRMKNLASSFLRAGERLMRLGFYMGMYLTLPILGAGAATLMLQKRFGATFKRMEILLGNTSKQLQGFKKEILNIAPKTGQGPFAMIKALQIVQQEGVEASQAMNLVAAAAKGATLTGVRSLGRFANAVANVRSAMKTTSDAAVAFVTKFIGKEGVNNIWRMSEVFGEWGATAVNLGISLDELGGLLGVLNDRGRRGWRIAGDMDKVFDSLISTTSELGMSLRKTLTEEGLVAFLERLDKMQAIPDLFGRTGRRAILGMLQNLDLIREEIQGYEDDVRTLDDMMEEFRKTVEFQFKRAISTLESTFIELGEAIKAPMVQALQWLNGLLIRITDDLRNLSKEQIDNRIKWTLWVAAIGPVMMALGLLITLIGSTISALQKIYSVLKWMALHPWAILATAIIFVVQWLVRLGIAAHREKKQMEELAKATEKYGLIMDAAGQAGMDATHKMRRNRAEISVYKDRLQELSQEIENQKGKLESLQKGTADYKIATARLNALEERKQRLIDTINRKYGDYIETNLEMSMSYNEMARQLDKVNKEMLKAVKITAYRRAMDEIQDKIVDLKVKLDEAGDKWEETFQKMVGAGGLSTKKLSAWLMTQADWKQMVAIGEYNDQLDNLAEKQLERAERKKMLEKRTQRLIDIMAKEGLLTEDMTKKQKEQNETLEEYWNRMKKAIFGAEAMTTAMETLRQRLDEIQLQSKAFGKDFDIIQEKADAYRSAIEGLITEMVKADKVTDKQRKNLTLLSSEYLALKLSIEEAKDAQQDSIEEAKDVQQDVEDIFKREMPEISPIGFEGTTALAGMQKQLAITKEKEEMLGDTFDANAAKLQAYKQAFNKLVEIKISDEKLTENQRKQYEWLGEQIKKLKEETLTWQDITQRAANQMGRIVADMAEAIGKAIGGTENAFEQFISTVLRTAMQFTQAMLAEAAAALIAGETIAHGLVGLAIAATVGLGALYAVWQKHVSGKVEEAQKVQETTARPLASGGIIPEGYPNDSYPAMLTSGETVIPAGELDEDKMNNTIIHPEVIGIEGETIKIALNEYNRRKG